MTVHIKTVTVRGTSLGWTSGRSLTIDAGLETGELRVGFSADQLLCFAIGASYITSLLDVAARRGIHVTNVAVDVSSGSLDNAADATQRNRDITISVTVEADADERDVRPLIEASDKAATVSNLVRLGASVRLTQAHVTKSPPAY